MANELKHKDIGDSLSKVEFHDVTLHQLDSQAAGNIIIATSNIQLSRLAKGSNTDILTLASGLPSWVAPAARTQIASGTYTGDDTVNRAIPHGLGVTPKIVLIQDNDLYYWFRITDQAAQIYYLYDVGRGIYAVTAMTTTNFYVGNATDYPKSANKNLYAYYWVAIG